MHGWETRMLLRHSLQRGVSKAALARRFGVSRRTIHEWVETGTCRQGVGDTRHVQPCPTSWLPTPGSSRYV